MRMRAALISALVFCTGGGGAAADSYALDGAHTQVLFKADRFGLSNTFGSFADVSGELILDEDNPENSSVNATINVASLRSDDETREAHLKSARWLDADAFPTITFASSQVTLVDDETAKVKGVLRVKDISKDVTLDVSLKNIGTDPATKRKAVGFSARTVLNRHDFGVSTAEKLIGADVEIYIETLAHLSDAAE